MATTLIQAVDTGSARLHACGVITELEAELEGQTRERNDHGSFEIHTREGERSYSLERLLESDEAWDVVATGIGAELRGTVLVVVVYAFNRPSKLASTLRAVRGAAKEAGRRVAVVVSIDGFERGIARTAMQAAQPLPTRLLVHPVSRALRAREADKRASKLDWSLLRLKAHWWWVMDSIFGQDLPDKTMRGEAPGIWSGLAPPVRPPVLPAGAADGTLVLFLEEDMVLSSDAFVALQELERRVRSDSEQRSLWGLSLSVWGTSVQISANGSAIDEPPEASLLLKRFGHTSHGYGFWRRSWQQIRPHKDAFWRYRDGWDWSFYHLQQKGLIPPAFIVPALSRLRNVGDSGLTVTPESYKTSPLGTAPVSEPHASDKIRWELFDQTRGSLSPAAAACRPCFQCEWC
jgi:hypothetical protein